MSDSSENFTLSRMLSLQSQNIFSLINTQCKDLNEEDLVLALQAIKIAFISGRITDAEKTDLQNQMAIRSSFDPLILSKLNKVERFALEQMFPAKARGESEETMDVLSADVSLLNKEVNELKSKLSEAGPLPLLCFICHNDSSELDGIECGNTDGFKHYQCNECLSLWTNVLNGQRITNFDLLKARQGLVKCTAERCLSPPFSRSQMCHHVKDEFVLEDFLDNLQYLESLKSYAEYQEKLMELTKEISIEVSSEEGGSVESDRKRLKQLDSTVESSTERLRKRIELEALAQTLKMQMPDARQCAQCGFGPMLHRACDDLQAHHGDHVSETATINNSCPDCGWLADSWSEWLPWSGALPSSVAGGDRSVFCLGRSDDSKVVLTPQEEREARLNALEKSIATAAAMSEASKPKIKQDIAVKKRLL